MRTQIHVLTCLVEQLEEAMLQIKNDDIVEPAVWSSCALTLSEVANRSLLLRRRALVLAAAALESGRQTSLPL
jgi:hypothetical protein